MYSRVYAYMLYITPYMYNITKYFVTNSCSCCTYNSSFFTAGTEIFEQSAYV